jgi:hypothetical protein
MGHCEGSRKRFESELGTATAARTLSPLSHVGCVQCAAAYTTHTPEAVFKEKRDVWVPMQEL